MRLVATALTARLRIAALLGLGLWLGVWWALS